MTSVRFALRSTRALFTHSRTTVRPFSISTTLRNTPDTDFSALNARCQDTAEEYRRFQIETPLNPHFTNTNSTIANDMPNLGADAPPPELIKNVDPNFTPKDAEPRNTERMTGGTQDVSANKANTVGMKTDGELGVGELEGASFKVEPLRRTGEDEATMRARLLYQSRKRGTLESELLMSTFADANLASMSAAQLQQYDLFLDENDWDIYYWATQEPTPTSLETAEGSGSDLATPNAQGTTQTQDEWKRAPAKGEWAQTVGTFKPAYRPVPARWRDSEILKLLREHVESRSAGEGKVDAKGLGKMPEIKVFDN